MNNPLPGTWYKRVKRVRWGIGIGRRAVRCCLLDMIRLLHS